MGTLFNQGSRKIRFATKNEMICLVEDIIDLANHTGIDINQAIEIYKLKESELMRQTLVNDYNIKDEQLSVFGELFGELISKVDNLSYAINTEFEER